MSRDPQRLEAGSDAHRGNGAKSPHRPVQNKSHSETRDTGAGRPPKKDKEDSQSSQDVTELKDYQLGDCLGKGAFGSVFRALNMGTGETVAVKQVKLADLPKSELRVITLEIDLLKNLDASISNTISEDASF
ncbi:MAG: hypothetical protein Q9186_001181 [Xanthomendoza sp. 1 TL-2023]